MSDIDTSGHNLNKVGIPVSGMTAIAKRDAHIPTNAEIANPDFVLPGSYTRLGLRKNDGAAEWAESPAAPIEMYEEDNEVSPRNGTLQVTQTFAQDDNTFRAAVRGVAVVDGVQDIDIDNLVDCILFTEDLYLMPDGTYELDRKVGPAATIISIAPGKNSRGEVTGTVVTWRVKRSPEIGRRHYRSARIPADATPDPVILSISPDGVAAGGQVVISGYRFTGLSGVTVGGTAVTSPLLANDETIVIKLPTGTTAGDNEIVVTTPDGSATAIYVAA